MANIERHRNDIYRSLGEATADHPVIPAATVVLARDGLGSPEVLMLQKKY